MRRSASIRGHRWAISYETFCDLVVQPCHYCGEPPFQVERGKTAFNGGFTYSGLDRCDNTEGYVIDNVVPCCGTCNYAKRALGVDEFIAHVRKICRHQDQAELAREALKVGT